MRRLEHRDDSLLRCERRVETGLEVRRRDLVNYAQHVARRVGDGRMVLQREDDAVLTRPACRLAQSVAATIPSLLRSGVELRLPPDLAGLQIASRAAGDRD